MKTSDFTNSLAAAIAAAACLYPTLVRAERHVLDLQQEPQQGVNLCWAAVSTMAVRSFPEDFPDPPITQQLTVIYGLSQVHSRLQRVTRVVKFRNFQKRCETLSRCNETFEPWLYRVDSNKLDAENMVLPEAAIAHEIVVRKRPVIIKWDYSNVIAVNRDSLPELEHSLIITGYDDVNHEVRIYNPWPPAGRPETRPQDRERWLPYSVYVDPGVLTDPESGRRLGIKAIHKDDIYLLRRIGQAKPKGVPAPVRLASHVELRWMGPHAKAQQHERPVVTDDLQLTRHHVTR